MGIFFYVVVEMRVCLLLLVALLFTNVHCGFEVYMTIDDFESATSPLAVIIPPGSSVTQSFTNSTSTHINNVLGGERDLIVTVEGGDVGNFMSASVQNGKWQSNSPQHASGFSTLQYDGIEGSTSISHTGLDCLDITGNGLADGFLLQAQATTPTDFKFYVYGYSGGEASVRQQVTTNEQTYYYIPFDTFNGEVDFTCVGAIQLTATIQSYSQFLVDTFVIGTYNPDQPSPSPSQSVLPPGISHSNTPTTTKRPNSNSPSPSKMGANVCMSSNDCRSSDICVSYDCIDGVCVSYENDSCCRSVNDCPQIECEMAQCNNGVCQYMPIGCIDSHSHPDETENPDDNGLSSGGIVGIVIGAVVIFCIVCVFLGTVLIVYKRKQRNSQSTSVYDAMISDM